MKFILVRPAYASNLGAAARAMATMGFDELVLVNPIADHTSDRAKALATHAQHILDNIKIVHSIPEALENIDLAVAATHRHRKISKTVIQSNELKTWTKQHGKKPAVIFGPESTGLNLSDLKHCNAIVTIPAACSQPSLNLAQAIMIIAYELSETLGLKKPTYARKKEERQIDSTEFQNLQKRSLTLLENLHLKPERYLARLGDASANDLNLLYDLLNKLENSKKT